MSNMAYVPDLPRQLAVKRTDPVYMAHAYLTKVPVAAIEPFVAAFTKPGDIVLDPFAGSGMTGVAAAALGRNAQLFDISVLGRHIGVGYTNLVDANLLRKHADEVIAASRERLGQPYAARCHRCEREATLAKTIWTMLVECPSCGGPVNYYRSLEAADWRRSAMSCPHCAEPLGSRNRRVGEEPVVDFINCSCNRTQLEQPWTEPLNSTPTDGLEWPDVAIEDDRQMFQASALGRNGLTSTAKFFSQRNLAALAALRDEINAVDDKAMRTKLLFAFTAILTRASKRYQWSRQRPLNAANANYYVAAVFYEWNVFDLYDRKIDAVISSDRWIKQRQHHLDAPPDVSYQCASADQLPLPDDSVDYVFTDPPFGSNIFYADMSLFQEVWLGEEVTDHTQEAVIDRSRRSNGGHRSAKRYETLITDALKECNRVLRPGGWITMVFGNSSGQVWSIVQRAAARAGLMIEPATVVVLDKGQRSVKGLASGFENIATLDLVLSLRPANPDEQHALRSPDPHDVHHVLGMLIGTDQAQTPSHLYVELLRAGLARGWRLDELDLRQVNDALQTAGYTVDPRSGRLVRNRGDGSVQQRLEF
jgi:16S rRNA G966 N2-methylase RsmD